MLNDHKITIPVHLFPIVQRAFLHIGGYYKDPMYEKILAKFVKQGNEYIAPGTDTNHLYLKQALISFKTLNSNDTWFVSICDNVLSINKGLYVDSFYDNDSLPVWHENSVI